MSRVAAITSSFILVIAIASPLKAQIIHGFIMNDEGEPLADVHVAVENSAVSTVSNESGLFRLQLENGSQESVSLLLSRIGYQTDFIKVDLSEPQSKPLTITLKQKIYRSEAVVVTATRTQQDIENVSIPVSVVTGEEMHKTGSMRLSDILSEQTGMQIVSDHGTGVQIQGFDPDYTLIMIDGSPVIGRTAGTLDLSRISVRNVEQIEIVKGPSSALWGSDALAGVVNIITKRATEELSGGITTRYGKNNTLDLSGDFSLNKFGVNSHIFGNLNSSAGYRLNPGVVSQTVPEFNNVTIGYRGDTRLSDQFEISGNIRWFRESQQNRSIVNNQSGEAELLNSDNFRSDFMGSGEVKFTPANRFNLTMSWITNHYGTESELSFAATDQLYSRSAFNQTFNQPEFKAAYRWSDSQKTLAGMGAIFEQVDAERFPGQPSFTTQFLFTQHSWSLSQNFEVTGGIRYDSHSEYSSQLSPKISTRYRVSDWIQFRASAGRGFKAPDFRQLFLDFTNTTAGYSVFGSSTVVEGIERQRTEGAIDQILIPLDSLNEIRAESSWALNTGFDIDPTPNLRFRMNLFRNNVSDLIETAPVARLTNGQSVFTYFNVDEVYTQGAEAEFRLRFAEQIDASLGYQYLDAQRRVERERILQDDQGELVQQTNVSFEPMFNRSRHSGNFSIFYESNNGWGANLRGLFRGRFGLFDRNGNGFVDSNELEPGYTVWNAALTRRVGKLATIQAGADNIFNYININQPFLAGRLWYAQVSISF